MTLTKRQITIKASKYADLDAQIKALTKERDEIKRVLTDYAKAHENRADLGSMLVTVTTSWRFDSAKVLKAFPPSEFPDYYKLAVDTESLKADVPESKRKALQTPSYTLNVARNDE